MTRRDVRVRPPARGAGDRAPDPVRSRRRRRALVGAVVGVLLLGSVALKVTVTLGAQHLGERAWRSGDHVAAGRWFAVNEHLNLTQRWIAPYNSGVAAYGRHEWQSAADWFEQSAGLAPAEAVCRVVLNHALALESFGDELTSAGDASGAERRYRAAQAILAEASGCSTDSPEGEAEGEEGEEEGDKEGEGKQEPDEAKDQAEPESESESESELEPGDGDPSSEAGESESSPGARSEQDQVDAATSRLQGKVGDGPRSSDPGDAEPTESQSDRLAERTMEGARRQQEAQDDVAPMKGHHGSGRTW